MGPVVDIGGLPVLLEGEDSTRREAIADLLGGVPAHREAPRVTIRYLREGPVLPARPPDRSLEHVRVWRVGEEVVLQDASGVRARAGRGSGWIGGESQDPKSALRRLFHPVASHVLAFEQRYVLHAAAIAVGSTAWLVLGRSGQGKSTLGLAALNAGWLLLGDDMVVVRTTGDGVEVAAVARRAMVPGDLGSPAPYRGRLLVDDPRERRELPTDALTPGWFTVGGVVLSTHDSSPEGRLRRGSARASLYDILDSFGSVGHPRFLHQFFPVAAALSRLPTWELGHGCVAGTRLEVAGRHLGRLATPVAAPPS